MSLSARMAWVLGPLLVPVAAQAGGFYSGDGGIRATGRAGAFVVGADDLSAQAYNPAALSRVGNQLTFGLAAVHQGVWFNRTNEVNLDGTPLDFDPVRNQAAPLPIPSLAGAFDFGVKDLTVAVGVYTPYAPAWSYDPTGAQRFASTDTLVLAGNVGPSVSYRFADRFSIGAGVAWTFLNVDQGLVAHVAPLSFLPEDDPQYDVATRVRVADWGKVTGNVGLMYETVDRKVAVGASYVPAVRYTPRGELTTDFSRNTYYTGGTAFGQIIADETAGDDDVALDVVLPHTVRAGVLVRPTGTWEVELDVVWEGWSAMPELAVRDLQLNIATTQKDDLQINQPVSLPLRMQDVFSVRVGAEGALSERVRLRGGVNVETGALASDQRSVFLPDGLKVGYGLGTTIMAVPKRLAIDIGWSQSLILPEEITSTAVNQVQIDPQSGAVGTGKSVGNGRLTALTSVLGIGLNWTPPRRAKRDTVAEESFDDVEET